MKSEPIVDVHNLTAGYRRRPAIWNLDFQIQEGKFTGILGPNGSGKSTLLKCLLGQIRPYTGYAHLWGQHVDRVRHRIAYVPQKESVDWNFPATVLDVVLMGRYRPGRFWQRLGKKDKEAAFYWLEQTGMNHLAGRQIGQLSGGQRQRVFLARALAREPSLLFLDEPFAGVDAGSAERILHMLKLLISQGKSIVMVHHDLVSAGKILDDAVLLNTRLVASGPVSEVFNHENLSATYGSDLSILSDVIDLVTQNPGRFKDPRNQKS